MRRIPTVRSAAFVPLASFLGDLGLDVASRFEARGVPREIVERPEAVLPEVAFWSILADVRDREGLPDAGYRLGASHRVTDIPGLAAPLGNRPTLMATIGAFASSLRSHNNYWDVWVERTPTGIRLCRKEAPLDVGRRVAEQYAVGYLVDLVRMAASPSWWPEEIWLRSTAELHPDERHHLGGARLHLDSAVTAISVPSGLLMLQPRAVVVAPRSEGFESRMPREVVPAVRAIIDGYLGFHRANLTTLARALGCHPRTFQRALSKAGTSLQALVDQARLDSAIRRLATSTQPITEIAFDLGYEEATSFSRAFRRWTGVSPRAYREAQSPSDVQSHLGIDSLIG